MRCPERFPCAGARAADVHAVPQSQGIPSSEFHQRPGETQPDLLQWGGMGDGRGKSSLLWIVIIGLLTTLLPPYVCVCV